MAVWLVRAGSHGEYEQKFIDDKRIYLTWQNLDVDLATLDDKKVLRKELEARFPVTKPNVIGIWGGRFGGLHARWQKEI